MSKCCSIMSTLQIKSSWHRGRRVFISTSRKLKNPKDLQGHIIKCTIFWRSVTRSSRTPILQDKGVVANTYVVFYGPFIPLVPNKGHRDLLPLPIIVRGLSPSAWVRHVVENNDISRILRKDYRVMEFAISRRGNLIEVVRSHLHASFVLKEWWGLSIKVILVIKPPLL